MTALDSQQQEALQPPSRRNTKPLVEKNDSSNPAVMQVNESGPLEHDQQRPPTVTQIRSNSVGCHLFNVPSTMHSVIVCYGGASTPAAFSSRHLLTPARGRKGHLTTHTSPYQGPHDPLR